MTWHVGAFTRAFLVALGILLGSSLAWAGEAKSANIKKAQELHGKGVRLKSDDLFAQYLLGSSYEKLSRFEETIKAYEEAIRMKPGDALFHYRLGMALVKVNQVDKSHDQYRWLKERNPNWAKKLFDAIYKD